jgi:sulfatase maturation enzyme AslB (radical SAM superfamily)
MNEKEYLTNKNFCPIPWTGLMYNFDGNVKNCIRSSSTIGNIQNSSLEEIVNGTKNVQTKTDMLSGHFESRCQPCYNLEQEKNKFDIISDRVFYLKELKTIPLELYSKPTQFDLQTVDVRWTNLCNFACVYCSPEFSSKWESELEFSIAKPSDDKKEKLKNYIFENASQLKHVYLAGGEPLLMKENLEFLQLLIKANPTVNLRINTNLSKVDTGIFDLVCKFKNVHWIVSVETVEQEYEYIRYGGTWLDFVDNLGIINQLGHKISFNMVHFLLNYKSIFVCVDYLKGIGFHNNSFIIGSLLNPEYLNIRHLPEYVLADLKKQLVDRINEQPGFLLENGYRNVLQYVSIPMVKNLQNSMAQLKLLDARRNLDSSKVFKDLYAIQ